MIGLGGGIISILTVEAMNRRLRLRLLGLPGDDESGSPELEGRVVTPDVASGEDVKEAAAICTYGDRMVRRSRGEGCDGVGLVGAFRSGEGVSPGGVSGSRIEWMAGIDTGKCSIFEHVAVESLMNSTIGLARRRGRFEGVGDTTVCGSDWWVQDAAVRLSSPLVRGNGRLLHGVRRCLRQLVRRKYLEFERG
jgi:hypothetical protein